MADPFSLSTQYQDRLDSSVRQLEDLPKYVAEGIRIPGIIAQNRILGVQAQEAQDALSVSQQLKKAVQDPHGIMGEFGDLKTAAQMRQFMAKHAAISISPVGQKLLGIFDKITTATEEAERNSLERQSDLAVAKKQAEFKAEMIDQGYTPGNPDDEFAFRRNRNWRNFRLEAATKLGKDVTGLSVEEDFDSSGRLTPQGEERILSVAPISEILQSRENVAQIRADSQERVARLRNEADRRFAPADLQKKIEWIRDEVSAGRILPSIGQDAIDIILGVKGREGAEKSQISKSDYVAKSLPTLRTAEVQGELNPKKRRSDEQLIKHLENQYDAIYGLGQPTQKLPPSQPRPPKEVSETYKSMEEARAAGLGAGDIFRMRIDGKLQRVRIVE